MNPVPVRISALIIGNQPGLDPSACIRSLLAGSVAPEEIVLVTQESYGSYEDLAAKHVTINQAYVPAGATWTESCKLGFERTTGEFVAVLDMGCKVEPNWLELLVSFLNTHPDTAAVEGKRRLHDDEAKSSASPICMGNVEVNVHALTWNVQWDRADRTREVAGISALAFVIRRSALGCLSGLLLDTRFQTELAANDLFARLLERRWHLYYVGQAIAIVTKKHTWAASKENDVSRARELLLFAWKHLSDDARDQQIDLITKAAYPGLRALLSPPTPAMIAAQKALVWLREHKRELAAEREGSPAQSGAFQTAVEAAQARGGYSSHARQDVLDLIPANVKVVVDVGCASGVLGAALKRQRPGVQVRGVEISPEAAELAREVLDDVFCGSAESPLPSSWPKPDCVVFADVLEHLPDPWNLLRRYREILPPTGNVVVSVPNIGHRSVINGILRGRFDYTDAGILDRTHLRFFTRETAIELIEQAGFKVERIHLNLDSPQKPRWLRVANRLRLLRGFLDDYQAIQFVLLARVAKTK